MSNTFKSGRLKKLMAALILGCLLFGFSGGITTEAKRYYKKSESKSKSKHRVKEPTLSVVGAERNSATVTEVLEVMNGMMDAANRHDIDHVLEYYSPDFISGDNLSLADIQNLIEETWKIYPDIKYTSTVQEVRVNGDWVTVESEDRAVATVHDADGLIDLPGVLKSQSRGQIFLRQLGDRWLISSDHTIYENATVIYGDAENLDFDLSVPDQVFAGSSYTAKLNVGIDPGNVVIASISKDPLVYPQTKPEDKFRTITSRQRLLERVFESNGTNNNEIITATIGLTSVEQGEDNRPMIRFNGVATVIKRVNVLPVSTFDAEEPPGDVVHYSAGGKIDLRKKKKDEDAKETSGN